MKTTYKIEKTFGPVLSFSGIMIFLTGLIATFFSLTGLILVVFGAFFGLTDSCTTIDFINRRVKYSNKLFGFIKTGKWIEIKESMKIGLKRSNKTYRTYSRSNRILDIPIKETRIYLFDLQGNPIIPLKSIDKAGNTLKELEDLSKKLRLTILK